MVRYLDYRSYHEVVDHLHICMSYGPRKDDILNPPTPPPLVSKFSIGSILFTQEAGAIGDHCIECASVAAVGAAAAAAAGGDGTGGGLTREAGAYTNPYASMLTPEKIQALEAHKNSAVAKR